MSELIPFTYENHPVRTVQIDGEPWFVGRDVCAVLDIAKPETSLALLDDDERATHTVGTLGGDQRVSIINEPGLYSLILRSRKPEAKAFKRWVTHEVLPAIRKTGGYGIARPAVTQLGRRELAQMVIEAEDARLVAEARVAELEPDAARARRTMDADGLSLVGTVAKRFGIQQKALWQFLHAEGLLIRGGNRHNEPYARYIESGHFELKLTLVGEDPDRPLKEKSTTFVTPKGEALIWKRLHDAGYVSSPVQPPRQLALI